ncbi:carbon-nitrogen hydrolase family protein [Lutimaribacter sp. EGI FJ00015]|uniref:Carbon-nitrogen hydrolase family protein n=1 Tax=Lutimaribacter degradans TaxID=2945989 RepID=A0ACC5ZWJ4_9RHOB|nr:carbon-nitrogen hydrolase family protein [Lutimaribacter sp. EGI FJ00013]MCM2561939.1 carbon-nitrogen hydrolase family protein [Lutimaribacter sp. EGI FJ00013]MCO0613029.1 carbon-nitrogen hydrolase family protein [Lutimaribacter sp. EGI FJ00015]MCO0635771.1 carbon-nitrogen hydrolase family protein [Lutimaribacter sp. EGI FJ00014]
MRAALLQLSSGDDPEANLPVTMGMVQRAVDQGAQLVLTPEVTNCVSASRTRQQQVLRHENDDPTLAAMTGAAKKAGVWILIGSLALKTDDADGRFANRSFLIAPDGQVAARYDKIHMFDVQVSETETYRESAGYRPGDRAVLARAGDAMLGMTICYDLRFAHLYRDLAQAGADVLAVPSAFSPVTGDAHWQPLLRARAIETGCFLLAPAQTGTHAASRGRARQTHGHSLAVAPWGEVLLDAGTDPGVHVVDLDLSRVAQARSRVPSLTHDRDYEPPDA